MLFLLILACAPKEECHKEFPCEQGLTCKVCCAVGGENCRTLCSDGWEDLIPPAATELDLQNDMCHCTPSKLMCQS